VSDCDSRNNRPGSNPGNRIDDAEILKSTASLLLVTDIRKRHISVSAKYQTFFYLLVGAFSVIIPK
jgi:hypothetical protein